MDLEQTLLAHVRDGAYQPVKPKVIAKQLGLDVEGTRELKRVIKRLVKRGKIAWGKNHLVSATRPDGDGARADGPQGQLTGAFKRMPAGYGFVRPSATPHALGKKQDVYIAAKNSLDASSGDIVLVQVHQARRPGSPGPEGRIVEIIERETNQFVGTYFERGDEALVKIDGRLFSQSISVGDPGAKAARPNDKVVIEMVRFPTHAHDGEGVIVRVLGARGAPGVDTLSIIHEFNLPGDFAGDALDDARDRASAFDEDDLADRTDFTRDTVITIDPVDARDFDDAISLDKIKGGHWRLGVHIADVSHFVQPGAALDREARDRATSVYLPDRVIPMLPEVISNNLASLQPDRVRYTVSAVIEFTAEGAPVAVDLHKGAIKSCRRFAYEEVDEYLAQPAAWKEKLTPEVHALLGRMHELAMLLRRRRFKRGSLELSMPEVKVDLDADGRVSGAHLVENTESHQIIEEFMLAANEAVAGHLQAKGISFLRRIHESPDPRKLKVLGEFVRELGIKTESLDSRFALQNLLAAVEGLPTQDAVNYAVLRSMQKAIYSPEQEGHYALASECYCHFTSPIRRYPDLTIHRLIEALLKGKSPDNDLPRLLAEGEHCSEREQRAASAERELTKVKLLTYMASRIGEEMPGVITGVEQFGLFIRGTEIPAEGFVHISALQDDYYHYDKAAHTLVGRRAGNQFRLGDLVKVAVATVDIDRRELDFRLIGRLLSPSKQPAGKGSRTPRRGGSSAKKSAGKRKTAQKKTSTGKATKTRTQKKTPAKERPKKKGRRKKAE
jgi:ribonuclease R